MPARLVRHSRIGRKVRLARAALKRRHWSEPPKGERWRLIWELDREVSRVVRARDKRCVTCGTRKGLTCSHYFKRGFMWTRFDLRNCNAQCSRCNKRQNTNPAPYRAYMVFRYGEEVIAELAALRERKEKFESWQMETLLGQLKAV